MTTQTRIRTAIARTPAAAFVLLTVVEGQILAPMRPLARVLSPLGARKPCVPPPAGLLASCRQAAVHAA